MAAIALDDDWELLTAQPTAPTPKGAAKASALASASAAASAAAELVAAKKEAAALRAELALARAQLLGAEQRTFTAEQTATRLTALNAKQRHTITQLSNQLAVALGAGAGPATTGAADAGAAPPLDAAAAAGASSPHSPAAALAAADASRTAVLRAMRRAAKAKKHQFKANANAKSGGNPPTQQPKQRAANAGRSAS